MTSTHATKPKHAIAITAEKKLEQHSNKIIQQLNGFDYTIHQRNSILPTSEQEIDLEIIITDFSDSDDKKLKELSETRSLKKENHPLIFISTSGEFQKRHKAVRYGGSAFLLTENNEMQLLDALNLLLFQEHDDFHVLIVDDDEELAEYYSILLEREGISTIIVHESEEALTVLNNRVIDLVLLDLRMPDCDGFEFATILRQLSDHISLPIIFISGDDPSNTYKTMLKQYLGADDFLSKPISDELLINTVIHRCMRNRVLQKIMQRDSATQLLNHSSFQKELALEVKRSTRRQSNFSYALLDLDHFKKINDQYGHAAGDRVLKVFSHMLKSRLRVTDILGRYGGEEFGVVLLDTPAGLAEYVIQQILDTFSKTSFISEGKEFFVTFSAGIAEFKRFRNLGPLIKAADQALYAAKDKGRNQIVIAN